MGDVVFNTALGRVLALVEQSIDTENLIAVPIEAADIEYDDDIRRYDTLEELLSGSSNEQLDMGRKVLTGITVTTDDNNYSRSASCNNIVWPDATGAEVAKLVIVHSPALEDASAIPLVALDFSVVPTGVEITGQVSAPGFFRAS